MTNSKYNAHTNPYLKNLKLLKLDGIFDIQLMSLFYKFTNKTLPKYFRSLFRYNREIYEIETTTHSLLHHFPTIYRQLRKLVLNHLRLWKI